jgi:hypothetical protein
MLYPGEVAFERKGYVEVKTDGSDRDSGAFQPLEDGQRAPWSAPKLQVIGTVEESTLGSTNATFDGGGLFS